jgi:hypothetical protein
MFVTQPRGIPPELSLLATCFSAITHNRLAIAFLALRQSLLSYSSLSRWLLKMNPRLHAELQIREKGFDRAR